MKYRIEKDSIGKVKVPSNAYYGNQTQRASNNFKVSNLRIHPELNKAIIEIKIAAALTNKDLKVLESKKANAIIRAGKEALRGKFDKEFILDVFQAGAGTPWHMNVNEVLANRALEILRKGKGNYKFLDPHDHVNMSQSSNDVIPTAIRISSLRLTINLELEIKSLIKSLKKKSREFKDYAKSGRTHLQDAAPITLGEEFLAWANSLESALNFIQQSKENLRNLAIGGTAIGTGLNAHPKFAAKVVNNLKKQTRLKLYSSKNKIHLTQFMNDFLILSSSLRNLAVDLTKICNDIRLLNSGPITGLNEIILPKVEQGSSIMPGKYNPSMAEMLNMVCLQVLGNDEVVKEASSSGELELNIMTPVLAHNLLESIEILTNGIKAFNNKAVKGIKANKETLRYYFEMNPSIGTILNPIIGYDKTSEIIQKAIKENKSVKEIVIEEKILSKKKADKVFSLKNILKK